jgi:hypothetical protein
MSARNAETRWAWCACVLAVAGCNQIFGNNSVTPIGGDANQPGIDAPFGVMTLNYAVEATPNQAAPTYTPFDTHVHVGPLDPLNLNLDDLTERIVTDGSFTVATSTLTLTAPRYRLIYSAPDGIDVELQSSVKNANLVIPRIGRLDRVSVATGSDLSVVFQGGPASWTHARFLGTGLWSIDEVGGCCGGATFVDYSTFVSMSGPLGAPQAADTLIFADSNSDSGGVYDGYHDKVYGYATVTLNGFDGSGAPVAPTVSAWKTPAGQTSLGATTPIIKYSQRAENILNDSPADDTLDVPDPIVEGGVIASENVMPFTENLANQGHSQSKNGDLDHVVFAPLGRSLLNPIRFVNPYNGTDAPAYPTAVYTSSSFSRKFVGTNITTRNGIQVVGLQMASTPAVAFGDGVGIANQITIGPTNTTTTTSLVVSDAKTVTAPITGAAQSYDLTFGSDSSDPAAAIDDCSVTLYRIDPTLLAPIKRYLINTLPSVPSGSQLIIDARLFDLVHQYTFGISCYHGHPIANIGDWRMITFPFAVSTVYSHSFSITP